MKINTISSIDPLFPVRLKNIPARPGTIYSIGSLAEYELGVAIVGTRKPTTYGRNITSELAQRLAQRGVVIISGLAHGIDGIAHQAAVNEKGRTIAVLACGLDQIYPAAHRSLAQAMLAANGALVSEYKPGTPPLQHRFLERNRLVSGLADSIIVTEASLRSGTMNTVSHALEQGRDVYAVPGPITSAMSAGCNALIAQGAVPIVDIDVFIDQVAPTSNKTPSQIALLVDDPDQQIVMSLIAQGINDGEQMQQESGLDAALFSRTLSMMELKGSIRALGANRWGL